MTDISRIQEKVEYAKSRYSQYLTSLVGLGSEQATTKEIELFNLQDAYDDGVLRRDEIAHIYNGMRDINFTRLVAERKIIYNTTSRQLEYRINTFDFNRDGAINQDDKDAVNHVINYFNSNVNTLTDMLDLAGDEDGIARFNIKSWAITRGMEEGTKEHDAFVSKFFDEYYMNPQVRASIELLGNALRLYDVGVGRENLNELDDFVLLLKEKQPLRLLKDFYRFTQSEAFNVPDAEKQEVRDKFIAALLNTTTKNVNIPATKERQKLVADSISRRRISITGGELTAQNLSDFIDRTGSAEEIAKMRIENIAKSINLENILSRTDDEYDLFVDKFYNEYYINSKEGLGISEVSSLARVYTQLKNIRGDKFSLDDLDVYNYGLNTKSQAKFYYGDMSLLLKLEANAETNGLSEPIREATIKNYIDIIVGTDDSDKRIKSHLKLALRSNRIPLTGEDLTIDKLNSFLSIAADETKYLDLQITTIANKNDLFDNPANPNDEFDRFLVNFREYAKDFADNTRTSNLNFLARLYDGANIDFDQLNILSNSLKNRATRGDLSRLVENYKKPIFNTVDKAEQFRKYAEILSGPDRDKKQIVSVFLRTGKIPYSPLEAEQIRLSDVDNILSEIDRDGGLLDLKIKHLARKSDIDESKSPTEFNNFVSTMTSWHNDKNLQLKEIKKLAYFYQRSGKSLDDLSIYANAIQAGVSSAEVSVIFRFEESELFDLIGAGRDLKIQEYLDIMAKPPETDADKERKSILMQSMRVKKIRLTGADLTIDNLDDILSRTKTDADIFNLKSDRWAERLDYLPGSGQYRDFKATVSALKDDSNVRTTALSSSVSFLANYPDLTLSDFDYIAQVLDRNNNKSADIHKIVKFVHGDKFSNVETSSAYKTEKLKQYLTLTQTGNRLEQGTLSSALRSGRIRVIDKEISVTNLQSALDLAQDEDAYRKEEIKILAKDRGYSPGEPAFNNFVNKFYNDVYLKEKMSIGEMRYLASFYSRGVFSDSAFNELITALQQRVSVKVLRNVEKFANVTEMPQDEVISYLRILGGEQGASKRQFLTQVFKSNFIPIANTRLF